MDCIFCKVVSGEIATRFIAETDHVVAFDDLNPQAPQHKLIIPKKHISTVNDLNSEDFPLVGEMFGVAKLIANNLKIAEDGYRLVMNCNAGAGQSVFHIHLHLLGGRPMNWPPG